MTSGTMRPVDEALGALLSGAGPAVGVEWVAVSEGLGRVLADDVTTPIDMPPWDNSAVDGYAFAWSDMASAGGGGLRIRGRYAAGDPCDGLDKGHAARVFTGAPIPYGADTVAMQEACLVREGSVSLGREGRRGDNVRRRAEERRAGERVLARGRRLRPQDVAIAASVGHERVPVYSRLRVAVLCTGSELMAPGESLKPGKIYNGNHYLLASLIHGLGCSVSCAELVPDDLQLTVQALHRAVDGADVIVSSGGVSVGEEDYIKTAVDRCGRLDWWKVAIKPGKPFAFGTVGGKPLLGLPGNPVSLFVTFCILARPFLLSRQGVESVLPRGVSLPAAFHRPSASRREYLGACIAGVGENAELVLAGPQGSGKLTAMTDAEGLAVIPEGAGVREGEPLTFLPFDELLS